MEASEDYFFTEDVRYSIAMNMPYDDLMNLCQTDTQYQKFCSNKWFWMEKVKLLTNKREVFTDSVLRARVEYFRVFVENKVSDENDEIISFYDEVSDDYYVHEYIIKQLETRTENWKKYFEMLKIMINQERIDGPKQIEVDFFGNPYSVSVVSSLRYSRLDLTEFKDIVYIYNIIGGSIYLKHTIYGKEASTTLSNKDIAIFRFLALISGKGWIGYCKRVFKNKSLGYALFDWLFSKPEFAYDDVDIDQDGELARKMKTMAEEGPFVLTNKTYRSLSFILNFDENKLKRIVSSGVFELTWKDNQLFKSLDGIRKEILLTDPRVYTLSVGGELEPFSTDTTTTKKKAKAKGVKKPRKPIIRVKQVKEREITNNTQGQAIYKYLLNPYGTMEDFYSDMGVDKGDSLRIKLVWKTEDGTERVLYLNDRTLETIEMYKNSELVDIKADSPLQEYARDFVFEAVDDLRVYLLE